MKKYLSILSALVFGAISIASTAHASLTQSGVNWHAYNAGDATKVDYQFYGVQTIATYATSIIGSVDYNYNSGGISLYLDGVNTGANSTSLTVYSYTYLGAFLSSQTFNRTGSYDQFVTLTAAQAPQFSYVSVYALLPASRGGTFRGITANY